MDRSSDDDDWQRAREAVLPPNFDLSSTIDLDSRSRKMAVVSPNAGWREIAMEAVMDRFQTDRKPGRRLDNASRRHPQQIHEWG
jgi:hypothetical protein